MTLTENNSSLFCSQNLRCLPKICDLSKGGPCDACAMLMDLDNRIADTRAQLEEQLSARWHIVRKVNQRHDPMVALLPVELAATIFKLCLPTLPSAESLLERSSGSDVAWSAVQKKLASINWNWRDIVYSSPDLWSSFNVWISLQDQNLFTQNLVAIRNNFERSGDLPLIMHIEVNPEGIDDEPPASSFQLFEVLCSQAHRWEYVNITAPHCVLAAIPKYASTFPKGICAPHLSHFYLFSSNDLSWDYYTEWDPSSIPINLNAYLSTPMYVNTPDITLTMTFLDFSLLRQLNVGCLGESDLLRLLSLAPHLTFVKLWITLYPRKSLTTVEDSERRTRITHTAMKNFFANGYYSDLFRWFTMPAVENLSCNVTPESAGHLRGFFHRSQYLLKTLDVFFSECTEDELIDVLDFTPGIKQLKIRGKAPGVRLFQHIGQTAHWTEAEPTTFLPHLRSFTFCTKFTIETFHWRLLQTMIPTRPPSTTSSSPLHEIGIELSNSQKPMTAEEVSDVVNLINTGVEIKIWTWVDAKNVEVDHDNDLVQKALENLRAKSFH